MNCRNEIYDCDRCDHRYRRVQKIVKQYDGATWEAAETHTFIWDGNNIVLEKIAFADGTARTCEYFWGADKSGSEHGAGGVEGLLAVSVDGVFYIPCYDHNGNIVLYVSEAGNIAARYTYDPYGSISDMSGALATQFSFGFSTKYHDREMGLIYYLMRFYHPPDGRWLNRDPIEEDGGLNLYAFAMNNSTARFDTDGCFVLPIMTIPDPTPIPPPEPSPSMFDHLWFAPLPVGEEKWFERNYAGWIAEARRRFTAEIEHSIDCKATTFDGPSRRIKIETSNERGGSTLHQTPGGNEQEYGDIGQSDWSADKILGCFAIDYVTPVKITYTNMGGGKRRYSWSTEMYIYDVLGLQEHDPIRQLPLVGGVLGAMAPSRGVKRATWILSGSGVCDCNERSSK